MNMQGSREPRGHADFKTVVMEIAEKDAAFVVGKVS